MKKVIIWIGAILPGLVFAQIQIDHNEIPHTVGMHWITNGIDSTTVNVGSSGGPHTWDFRGLTFGADSVLQMVIDKSDGYFSDSFPEASLVARELSFQIPDTSYLYYRLLTDSLGTVGIVVALDTTGMKVVRFNPSLRTPLPMSYNNQWTSSAQISITMMGYPATENMRLHCNANGYGQVQLDWGTFECLRVLVYDTVIISIPPYIADTAATINYEFWTENYGPVVQISSHAEETNPDFTEGNISVITRFQNGVEETQNLKLKTQNVYPNPFCERVNIKYAVPIEGNVSLKIYDVSGKLVRVLVDENKKTGEYNNIWNGMNKDGMKVNAGIYFYELSIPVGKMPKGTLVRQKLVMLK